MSQVIYNRLIVFSDFYFATKAERDLQMARFSCKLYPLPPTIHSSCGLGIRFSAVDLGALLQTLQKNQITWSAIYEYTGSRDSARKIVIDKGYVG